MNTQPYTREELYSYGPQRSFKDDAVEAAFLLGGIGTGNVSIGARGELRDWEIFNRPGKGNDLPYTFFAIHMKEEGKDSISRVLESRIHPPYAKSHGFNSGELAGLPRLQHSTMKGEYPFVWIDFHDDEIPVEVCLEAYTPFIPLNPDDSGIPCAIMKYRIKNSTKNKVHVTIAGSLMNAVGFNGSNVWGGLKDDYMGSNINEFKGEEEISGLYLHSNRKKDDIRYGSMGLMVREKHTTHKTYWLDGGWWDGIQDFWDDFCEDGLLNDEQPKTDINKTKIASLGVYVDLMPEEEKTLTFILSWYFPNRPQNWNEDDVKNSGIVRNHYTKHFENAWDVGKYVFQNFLRLENCTKDFHKALFSSTLPDYVLDAVSSNITVLRSTTCFWLDNGLFLGWEGCHDKNGCCEGNCTHVWNYAQTLAFLFPSLEREMRQVEFAMETDTEGKMAFRTRTVFNQPRWDFHPAADGQMGTIIRLYREWKISGDNDFLRNLWPNVKKALDFAFPYWDSDGDFVLDSQQHNTYDIEFYGPNSLVNSVFFAALKAGEEMARFMGDNKSAEKYRDAFMKGSQRMDEMLWGGEYYIQEIDDVNRYKYQYGLGCLSDQLLGQFMGHMAGLGYVLPSKHVKQAIKSVFRYNFLTNFQHHHNVQRTYVLNDEKGLLLCSWPQGGRPRLPFVYSDEVWTGIEYQVASHLIFEGFIDEGLTLVKAVRERHDGYRRNPWNEVECGHHYARSMASWGLLVALSGFRYDMVHHKITFAPRVNGRCFSTFWSVGTAWGTYRQWWNEETEQMEHDVKVLYGDLMDIEVIVEDV